MDACFCYSLKDFILSLIPDSFKTVFKHFGYFPVNYFTSWKVFPSPVAMEAIPPNVVMEVVLPNVVIME